MIKNNFHKYYKIHNHNQIKHNKIYWKINKLF